MPNPAVLWRLATTLLRPATGAVVALALAWGSVSAQAATFERGLLWLLEPPGGGRPSFLLGTMHVADPRVLEAPEAVYQAIGASHTAVFEMIETPETSAITARAAMFSDGQRLDDVIGDDLWRRLKPIAADYGLLPSVLRVFKPWALIALLSMPAEQMRLLARNPHVLDTQLQDTARQRGLTLVALETPAEQVAAFEGLSLDDQIALLDSLVSDKAANDDAFEIMIELYAAQDLAGIAALSDTLDDSLDPGVAARFMEKLKIERDARMFERLVPIMAEGGVFIAVGALHLTGESGLLQRFAEAGYRVRAVD